MGVGAEAEQTRALGPEPHHLGHDRPVVVLAFVLAAGREGRKGLLAQVAARREAQEGLDQRATERDGVAARQAALGRGLSRSIPQGRRQAREVVLAVEDQEKFLLVVQDVLPEARAEPGQPLRDRREPRAVRVAEARAAPHEAAMGEVKHAALLVGQRQGIAPLEQGVEAGEKLGVERDALPMPRQHG